MKILIVEDEIKIAESLKRGLENKDYSAECVFDGEEAKYLLESDHKIYDLVIMDINLPGVDGLTICKGLRAKGINLPIIMLTARDQVDDKVSGLDCGADDYLVKPFEFAELLARIRSLLRRPANSFEQVLKVERVTVDPNQRKVFIENKEVKLTKKEYEILSYLLRKRGTVVTRDQIIMNVWDSSYDSLSNVVDVHINNLKRKINNKDGDEIIESVRGIGYKIK